MYFYFIDTHYIFNEGKISQKVQVFMQVRRTNIKTILFFQKDPGYGAILTNGPETISSIEWKGSKNFRDVITDGQQRWTIWNLVRYIYQSLSGKSVATCYQKRSFTFEENWKMRDLLDRLAGRGSDMIWVGGDFIIVDRARQLFSAFDYLSRLLDLKQAWSSFCFMVVCGRRVLKKNWPSYKFAREAMQSTSWTS